MLVRRLVSGADVIIENFRAGTMERMGLGFEALSTLNPRLVYCQITGYGRTGPLSHQGGFDLIAQGFQAIIDGVLATSLFYRSEPGHIAAAPDDAGLLVRWSRGF